MNKPKLNLKVPFFLWLVFTAGEMALAKPPGVIIGMSDVQRAMSFDQGCRYTLVKLGVANNQTLEQTLDFCKALTEQAFQVKQTDNPLTGGK